VLFLHFYERDGEGYAKDDWCSHSRYRSDEKIISLPLKGNLEDRDLTPLCFESFLDSNECIDPDIVIRTSGESTLFLATLPNL
jgi:hypothetical protein